MTFLGIANTWTLGLRQRFNLQETATFRPQFKSHEKTAGEETYRNYRFASSCCQFEIVLRSVWVVVLKYDKLGNVSLAANIFTQIYLQEPHIQAGKSP